MVLDINVTQPCKGKHATNHPCVYSQSVTYMYTINIDINFIKQLRIISLHEIRIELTLPLQNDYLCTTKSWQKVINLSFISYVNNNRYISMISTYISTVLKHEILISNRYHSGSHD